jgi:DHA2 family multidrug resistance protein-like MFS transporter
VSGQNSKGSLFVTTSKDHSFDPLTAAATATTFGCFIYALTAAAQRENLVQLVPFLVLGLGALLLLLKRQSGHPAPMLPVDLLGRPMFALSTITSITSFAAQGLAFVALPFYFEQTLGRDSVDTGFLITTWPIVVSIAAPIAGRLSDKYPPGLLGGVGLSVLCVGFISLALLPSDPSALHIVLCMAICGAGFGGFQSPNLRAIMSSAPPHRSGGASGVIAMGRLIGQTSGAAVVALCLGIFGVTDGPLTALAIGAVFSAIAALASFARLWIKVTAH